MDLSRHVGILRRAFGVGVFPHEMSWILDLPGRGWIMPPSTVAERLPVGPDAHVLEVGPGSGHYSVAAARKVPQGTLTLLDLQPEMLAKCARRLEAAGIDNARLQVAAGTALPFDDACLDAVFLVTVFGEIADQAAFLAEAHRVLKDDGVIAITEHHPDPDFESAEAVADKLRAHGFVPSAPLGWRWAYTLHGRKAAA